MDSKPLLSRIELELQRQVSRLDSPRTKPFHEMLTYHMGWTGEGAGPEATGKRIRPLMVLLCTSACGPPGSLPCLPRPPWSWCTTFRSSMMTFRIIPTNAAAGRPPGSNGAPDGDQCRRCAVRHVEPGDHGPEGILSADVIVKAAEILHNTCLELTRGQFLDMSYEERNDLSVDDYWPMVAGKTAALLSACCHIGALLGGADEAKQESYRSFGHYLGIAFQVQDDILGIWGNESLTGKSAASDLVEGKNSLPVLAGLAQRKICRALEAGTDSIRRGRRDGPPAYK
jgi:geranylgeranyl diphosphate synthase, type I